MYIFYGCRAVLRQVYISICTQGLLGYIPLFTTYTVTMKPLSIFYLSEFLSRVQALSRIQDNAEMSRLLPTEQSTLPNRHNIWHMFLYFLFFLSFFLLDQTPKPSSARINAIGLGTYSTCRMSAIWALAPCGQYFQKVSAQDKFNGAPPDFLTTVGIQN